MKRMVFALLATLVAALVIALPETSAQDAGGVLRLGVSQCPDGYDGVNYDADCTVPAAGIEFFVSTPNTDNIASGISSDFEPITFSLAQFDLNPDGPDTIWIGEPATYDGAYHATCATAQTPVPVTFEMIGTGEGTLYSISIEFDSVDDIVCNWYRIDGADGGVAELPNTGAGPVAHSGWWR